MHGANTAVPRADACCKIGHIEEDNEDVRADGLDAVYSFRLRVEIK